MKLGIHILHNPIEVPKRRGEIDINKIPDSIFTKICKKILNTSENLGKNPFQVYQFCDPKYELFGSNDEIIKNEKPFCFDNLDKFFCNFMIFDDVNPNAVENNIEEPDENDIPDTDNSEPCVYQNLTGLVLGTIQGCLKVIKIFIIIF